MALPQGGVRSLRVCLPSRKFLAVWMTRLQREEFAVHISSATPFLSRVEVEIGIERSCGQFIPERGYKLISGICSNTQEEVAEYQNGSATFDFHLSEVLFRTAKQSQRLSPT